MSFTARIKQMTPFCLSTKYKSQTRQKFLLTPSTVEFLIKPPRWNGIFIEQLMNSLYHTYIVQTVSHLVVNPFVHRPAPSAAPLSALHAQIPGLL